MIFPSFIQFYPTLRCNQHCGFCFNQSLQGSSSAEDMPRHLAMTLAAILARTGFQEVDILGGEPLLVPWMREFVRHATDSGMTVNISTNGSLPEKIEELADIPSGSINVGFSLHGFAETHNALTASENFSRVIQGIQNMIQAGRNPVVKSTLTAENIDEIHALIVFLKHLGVKRYYLLHEDIIGRSGATGLSFPEFNDYFQEIRDGLKEVLDIGFVAASAFYKYGSRAQGRCDAGVVKLAILPDGAVFPCNLFFGSREFFLGNIFRDDLQKILGNPVLEQFRNFRGNHCTFNACIHHSTCTGGCPAHSYYFHRSLDSGDPRCTKRADNCLQCKRKTSGKEALS